MLQDFNERVIAQVNAQAVQLFGEPLLAQPIFQYGARFFSKSSLHRCLGLSLRLEVAHQSIEAFDLVVRVHQLSQQLFELLRLRSSLSQPAPPLRFLSFLTSALLDLETFLASHDGGRLQPSEDVGQAALHGNGLRVPPTLRQCLLAPSVAIRVTQSFRQPSGRILIPAPIDLTTG